MKRGGGRPKSLKCCEIDRKTYKLCKKAAHKLCELGTCHSPECRASVEEACAEEARALVLARGEEPDAETLQNYNDIAVPGLQKSQKDYFLEQASKKKREMEALVADVMRKKATVLEEARTSKAAKRARAELEESAEKRRRVTAQTQLPPVDLSSQPLLSLSDPLGDLGLLPPLPSPADGGDEEGLGDGDERVEDASPPLDMPQDASPPLDMPVASGSHRGNLLLGASTGGAVGHTPTAALLAAQVLPQALDVLEVLVAAAPGSVAMALTDNLRARRTVAVAESISRMAPITPPALRASASRGLREPQGAGHPLPSVGAPPPAPSAPPGSPLPPVWGPGLSMDGAVLAVLVRHGRQGLIQCLAELGRVTKRRDHYSFQPAGLGAAAGWGGTGDADGGGGGGAGAAEGGRGAGGVSGHGGGAGQCPLPDPGRVLSELGFVVCGNLECGVLHGSSEAELMALAYRGVWSGGGGSQEAGSQEAGGGVGWSLGHAADGTVERYCCLRCRQQAERVVSSRGDVGRWG